MFITLISFNPRHISNDSNKLIVTISLLPELTKSFKNEPISVELIYDNTVKIEKKITDTSIVYFENINAKRVLILVSGSIRCSDSITRKHFYYIDEAILNSNTTNQKTLTFPNDCDRNKYIAGKICPLCKKYDSVIPVYNGHPDPLSLKGEFGIDYMLCCPIMSPCDPDWHCKRDNHNF